ncbi:tetratricopeptide repeat protein [Poseidonocella sedimentorum]|uniref:Tetratricopeptide repeat-containing protein n=1 Tax=Poseidonocella sedimentorum TaxID=871652 RepID=A0A1I6ENF1_9RHOB|nr:tetratricopeptide repeat protein [Poseidonocella sedimentorum]SFR19303.1 Tetratricopeptide repeat-containing protein [Poseidonocella sedimentorum]
MTLRNLVVSLLLCVSLAACDSPEEKAQAHYERGLELLAEGDTARARVEFRNALQEVNTLIEPRLELARLELEAGALRPAYREYLRVVEQDPENTEALVNLGQISFLTNSWETFDRYAPDAIAKAPDDPDARILALATRYREAVQAEDSPARSAIVAEAEAIEAERPDHEVIRRILLDGYLADLRFDDLLEQLDKAIAADPDERNYFNLKLQVLSQIGDEAGLEAQLREMVEIFPEDTAVQGNLLRYLVSREKIDEAEAFLRARVEAAPEGDDGAFVNLVQFLLQLRSPEVAMAELDSAVAARPEAYTLRALHASLRFDAGARDEAIADLEEIIASASATDEDGAAALPDADLENLRVTLANMLARNGNEVGARRLVEEILNTNPEVVGALKMQARWMIADDQTDEAVNAMRLALAKQERDFEAMTIMAEAYQRAGKQDLMMDFLALAAEASNNAPEQALRYAAALRADERHLQAETALISALRLQPDNIDLLSALGQVYLQIDDLSRVRQVVDALEKLEDPRAAGIASNFEIELIARDSSGRTVISRLRELVEEDGEGDSARIALIQAHMQSGEAQEALRLINDLIAENPENMTFVYFKGLAEAMAGEIEAATQTLTELVAQAPDADLAWIQLARMQSVSAGNDAVAETLDAGIAANPASPDLLWAKASLLQEQGDIDGAIDIYQQLYDTDSSSMIIANNLASLLATYREDDESLERARLIARRLNGTTIPALQDTYGWILFRTGDAEAALDYLEPAAEELPKDATVQFHLGVVYDALGRKSEALTQMRRAIQEVGPLGSAVLTDDINAYIADLEAAVAAQ